MKFTITWPNGAIEETYAASRDELINSMWGSAWTEFEAKGGQVFGGPDDAEDELLSAMVDDGLVNIEETEDEESANARH